MTRTLAEVFGRTKDGSPPPIPYPDSAVALAGAIYSLCHLAATSKADTVVVLTQLHAASILTAELHERMEQYRNWIPALPEIPAPVKAP